MTATTLTDKASQVKTPPPPPLLIDIRQLAVLLNRSVASLERDQAAGRLPAPVRIGGSKKWRCADIETWVAAGCPVRTTARKK